MTVPAVPSVPNGGWLASIDAARNAIAQVERVDEAKGLLNMAETAKKYARNVLKSREAQNHAAHISLMCQRKGGDLLVQHGFGEHGGDRKSKDIVTLDSLGVTSHESKRWQRLASIPDTQFEDAVTAIIDAAEELTTAGLLRKVLGAHVGNNAGNNEWYTPVEYIDAARSVMGSIDVDPASSEAANEVVRARVFWTMHDDGLKKPWAGNVWMNPPYEAGLIDKFCARLTSFYKDGDVKQACVLVNNATETGWFHVLVDRASAICFPKGRVRFWNPDKESAAPLQGQAIVYLGLNRDSFREQFNDFGFTVQL